MSKRRRSKSKEVHQIKRRTRATRREGESEDRDSDAPSPWVGRALLLGLVVLFGVPLAWFYQNSVSTQAAVEEVQRIGGKTRMMGDSGNILGVVNLAGLPIDDAELARLRPFFEAANGPHDLDLSRTKITDTGLSALAGLTSLCRLRLDGTSVRGPGLVHLRNLGSGLDDNVEISLAKTSVDDEGLTSFQVREVDELDLSGCPIKGPGLADLRSLAELNTLKLDDCPIDDAGLAALEGWDTLVNLSIARTRITGSGFPSLKKLRDLNSLDVSGNRLTDADLGSLAGLQSLRGLSLADTTITPEGILRLKDQQPISSLNLNGTAVNDDTLSRGAGWPTLQSLSLERTAVTDAGLEHLARYPKLDRLLLRGSRTTNAGIERLRKARPGLLIDN